MITSDNLYIFLHILQFNKIPAIEHKNGLKLILHYFILLSIKTNKIKIVATRKKIGRTEGRTIEQSQSLCARREIAYNRTTISRGVSLGWQAESYNAIIYIPLLNYRRVQRGRYCFSCIGQISFQDPLCLDVSESFTINDTDGLEPRLRIVTHAYEWFSYRINTSKLVPFVITQRQYPNQ